MLVTFESRLRVYWCSLYYFYSCFVVVPSLTHVPLFAHELSMTHGVLDCSTPAFPGDSEGLSSRVCSNSCPLSRWCHPTISSSVVPFSSCPQSFPASGSFPMSQLFLSGGQSIGASASVLPMNIQGWFHSGLPGLISLLSKGLSRVFSSTTIWKHHFFSTQPSLWSNSHFCNDYWKNHSFDYMDLCQQSDVSAFYYAI